MSTCADFEADGRCQEGYCETRSNHSVCICTNGTEAASCGRPGDTDYGIIIVVVSLAVAALVVVVVLSVIIHRRRRRPPQKRLRALLDPAQVGSPPTGPLPIPEEEEKTSNPYGTRSVAVLQTTKNDRPLSSDDLQTLGIRPIIPTVSEGVATDNLNSVYTSVKIQN